MSAVSWPFTIAPRIATPNTAPGSRLVLVAEAARPECSGGIASSTALVTGTSAIPKPAPAIASDQLSCEKPTLGPTTESTIRIQPPPITQPIVIGHRGPARATPTPLTADAAIITTVIGTKSAAVP